MLSTIKNILFFLLFIGFSSFCKAQADNDTTLLVASDSSVIDTSSKVPREWSRPEKAALLSATIPGLGQLYNKKYWKIPIIWIGEGILISSAISQHTEYKKARNALNCFLLDSIPLDTMVIGGFEVISENNYRTARDKHRAKRDNFIVFASLLYALSIVDAVVDAHLSEFDLSDNLSLKIKPSISPINNTFATGISLNFKFK